VDETGNDTGRDAARAKLPWDLHPALTEERLAACARLLARGRADAVAHADPWMGDDAWSIGCRAYSFSRNRLRQAAEGGRYRWLGVLDATHHFVFLIDGVPVRFFRGDAEEPSKRTLRRQESEAQQLALALGDADRAEGLMFRLAVETGEGGEVTRVVFLALRGEDGATECFWPVPLDHADVSATGGRNAGATLTPPLAAGTMRRRG
jgi:hypothetical protein